MPRQMDGVGPLTLRRNAATHQRKYRENAFRFLPIHVLKLRRTAKEITPQISDRLSSNSYI
jgi:hypothetical protein